LPAEPSGQRPWGNTDTFSINAVIRISKQPGNVMGMSMSASEKGIVKMLKQILRKRGINHEEWTLELLLA